MAIFHYGFIPAAALYSIVAGVTLSTYSFKATVFMVTGSLSLTKLPMPDALMASKMELLVGVILTVASGGFFAIYTTFQTKQQERRRPRMMLPYDPTEMRRLPTTTDRETAVQSTEDGFSSLDLFLNGDD